MVRVAESYPLDKLVREAFDGRAPVHGSGWLEPVITQYVKAGTAMDNIGRYVPNEPTKAQPAAAAATGKAPKGPAASLVPPRRYERKAVFA